MEETGGSGRRAKRGQLSWEWGRLGGELGGRGGCWVGEWPTEQGGREDCWAVRGDGWVGEWTAGWGEGTGGERGRLDR